MPKEIKIAISRNDLPQANSDFGLEEEDFDLSKAKVWLDDVIVEPSSPREKDRFVGKAEVTNDRHPRTLVVTTDAGKPIAFLKGQKIPLEKETTPTAAAVPSSDVAGTGPGTATPPAGGTATPLAGDTATTTAGDTATTTAGDMATTTAGGTAKKSAGEAAKKSAGGTAGKPAEATK